MKNLEIEYKQQIANEVPDLWSKIEAGITAVDKEREKNNNVVSLEQAKAKPKKKVNILKYSAIIGAAACVLVVVFAMFGSENKHYEAAATSAAMPMNKEAVYEAEAPAAACEETVCESADDVSDYSYDSASSSSYESDEACGAEAACTEEAESDIDENAAMVNGIEAVSEETVISGTLIDSVTMQKYMIIEVSDGNEDTYIFVPEDKMEEVSELEINSEYEVTVRTFGDERPDEVSNNASVTCEFISAQTKK